MYDFAIRLWEVVRETAAWDLVPMLFAFAGALFAVYVADRLFFESRIHMDYLVEIKTAHGQVSVAVDENDLKNTEKVKGLVENVLLKEGHPEGQNRATGEQ